MEFNEQEKGILIGVILTVMFVYTFNFFFPSQTPSKLALQEEEIQQTHVDRLLNEPLGLYTGVEKIDEDKSQRKRKALKRKRKSRKKIAARKRKKGNRRHAKRNKVTSDEKKKDEDKKAEDEDSEEKSENTNIANNDPYTPENIENNESSGISGMSGSLYPNHMGAAEDGNTHEFDTVEEWVAYFVNAQSLSSIDKFINAYLSKEISGSLFYAVIEELLINFRENLNHYGIIALNKVPSAESFEHLVHISEDSHHPPSVQARAIRSFGIYTDINYTGVLITVLDSSKDSVRLKAIEVAKESAQNNLRPDRQPSSQQTRQRVSLPDNGFDRYKNVVFYDSLKSKLESMAQQDANPTVRTQASQAASIINDLLQQFKSSHPQ